MTKGYDRDEEIKGLEKKLYFKELDLANELDNSLKHKLNCDKLKTEKEELVKWLQSCYNVKDDVIIRHVLRRLEGGE